MADSIIHNPFCSSRAALVLVQNGDRAIVIAPQPFILCPYRIIAGKTDQSVGDKFIVLFKPHSRVLSFSKNSPQVVDIHVAVVIRREEIPYGLELILLIMHSEARIGFYSDSTLGLTIIRVRPGFFCSHSYASITAGPKYLR